MNREVSPLRLVSPGTFTAVTTAGLELLDRPRTDYEAAVKKNSIEAYQEYASKYPESPQANSAREAIQRLEQEQAAYRKASQTNTVASYRAFLAAYPRSSYRLKALETLAAAIGKSGNALGEYTKFTSEYPDGAQYIPAEYSLYFVGPEKLTVADIIASRKSGISDRLIVSKIASSGGMYKDFSFEEIRILQKKGLSDEVIEAMVQSTTKATEAAARQAEKEKRAERQERQERKHEEARSAAAASCKKRCTSTYDRCFSQCAARGLGQVFSSLGKDTMASAKAQICMNNCSDEETACSENCTSGAGSARRGGEGDGRDETIDSTGSNIRYAGAYAAEVQQLLSRAPGWRTPTCVRCSDGTPPSVPSTPCQRDAYVAAAVNYAWAAESYARNGNAGQAESNARSMRQNLNNANRLCSTAPSAGNMRCSTENLWSCSGW